MLINIKVHVLEISLKFPHFHTDHLKCQSVQVLIKILWTLRYKSAVIGLSCQHTSVWNRLAQWSVAPCNETAQTSCAEKQNYAFRSEKQKHVM